MIKTLILMLCLLFVGCACTKEYNYLIVYETKYCTGNYMVKTNYKIVDTNDLIRIRDTKIPGNAIITNFIYLGEK